MKETQDSEQNPPRELNRSGDLPDSPRDEERLQPEETTIELPDVKDIPGQEFIHPPALGELADTTIASDDEEGTRIFEEDADEFAAMGSEDEDDASSGGETGDATKEDR